MRVIIIGAGPTGLGAAHRLNECGHDDFMVYDQAPYFGGLATSFVDDKGFTWDFAVHVAHSHYHYFDDLMEQLLPNGFYEHRRMAWVWQYERFIPYPYQNNIRHLPPEAMFECVNGILQNALANKEVNPSNFDEWINQVFGDGIGKHFLQPYNEKIWSTPTPLMGHQWTGDRVPKVDLERIVKNIIFEKDDVNWGPNATFQFPKKGGTGAIWKKLGESLPQDKVRLNCGITAIDPIKKTVTLGDGSTDHYDHLISTMPIPKLTELTGLKAIDQKAKQLRYAHTQVVGLAPNVPMPEHIDQKTWLYVPTEDSCFYRVTPFSLFSPDHVPDTKEWCSFLCEISTPGNGPKRPGDITQDVINDFKKIGLIDIDPETTHSYVMETEFGYPVPTVDRDDLLNEIIPGLEKHNIYSRGRFGGWKYEVANMDHSVMQGVECVNRLLTGEEEVTWASPNIVNAGKR